MNASCIRHRIYICMSLCLLICCLFACATGRPTTDQVDEKKRAKALQEMGNALVMKGDLRAGLGKLLEAHKLDPDNVDLNHQIAIALRDLGQYDLSLKYFQRTLSLDPKLSEVRNNLGTLYLLMEKWDAAIACFKEAISDILYKTPQYAYNNMGYAYYKKGDYDRAIECYKQALSSSRSYTLAHVNLAQVYEAKGALDQSVDAYRQAVLYAPKDAAAHLGLAKVLLKQGEKAEAKEELDLTIWAAPMSPEANEARKLLKNP